MINYDKNLFPEKQTKKRLVLQLLTSRFSDIDCTLSSYQLQGYYPPPPPPMFILGTENYINV